MITEASEIAFLRGINEDPFAQGHEVEMFDAFFTILRHPLSKRRLVDDFTDVLIDECMCWQGSVRTQAEALLLCFDDGDFCKLSSLEALILTSGTATTLLIQTFDFSDPVDTIGIVVTSPIDTVTSVKVQHQLMLNTKTGSVLTNISCAVAAH